MDSRTQTAPRSAPRRLRIAHVTATFPPYYAGTGMVCYFSALELARRGHEVTVFTAANPGRACEYPPDIRVRHLAAPFRVGNAPLLPGLLKIRDVDVIHLHYPFISGAELVWAVSRLRGIPYVLTHHNDLVGDGLRRFIFGAYSAVTARLVFGGARYIAAVSHDHAASSRLRRLFRSRWHDVVEVPNGVSASQFRPGLDGSPVRRLHGIPVQGRVALFVGALDRAHHFKGLGHLLRALTLVPDDVFLLIVGDGDLRERYAEEARALGLGTRVRFAGAAPNEELPAYYAAADLLVLPSFPPESFGVVLIEAMASGKPVVAQDIPGVRAVVQDGVDGLLARAGDPADLAHKMEALLGDPALRERMGAAGRRKVEERYDWRVVGDRLERLYFSVVAGDDRARARQNKPWAAGAESLAAAHSKSERRR